MTQDIRICFIGDSLVNGTGDEAALGWAGRLCAMTNASDIPVTYYNLGIRRNTSKDILLRWESECTLRLPDFCDGRIVLSCGVNDTAIENGKVRVNFAESCANVRAILRGAKQSERFCAEPSNTHPCLWLVRRRLLMMNKMRESKTSRLPFLTRHKRLESRTLTSFLRFARMTPIDEKCCKTTALIREVRAIPRWRVL